MSLASNKNQEDAALSRRKQEFDSPRERQRFQMLNDYSLD